MNIPELHTNLLWDLSGLTIFLSGLYFSCIFFFRSPLWKSIAATARILEPLNPAKPDNPSPDRDPGASGTKDPGGHPTSRNDHFEDFGPETPQGTIINDIEVDYEVLIDPAIEKQIHEILESYVREHREKEVVFSRNAQEGTGYRERGDMLDFGNIALPPARFYNKKENKRVKLLHAIAELGDAREVPLLQGMLDQERNESIGILIKEIILGFLSERPVGENGESETPPVGPLCEHYVYKYLFRAIDTESQYLLLDEVLKIGGQEELDFLRTLDRHPDEGIRGKARSIGDRLEHKLRSPQQDGITAEYGRAHPINRFKISYVRKIGELSYPKFGEMRTRAILHLRTSISRLIGKRRGPISSKDPIRGNGMESDGKSENNILHIDFELDGFGIEGGETLQSKQFSSGAPNKIGDFLGE